MTIFIQWINSFLLLGTAVIIARKFWFRGYERLIATLVLFFSAIIFLQAFDGYVVHALTPQTHLFIILIGLAVAVPVIRKVSIVRDDGEKRTGPWLPFRTQTFQGIVPSVFSDKLTRVLGILLVLVAGYELICVLVFPEFGWDSIVYHISNLPYWHQQKSLLPYPTSAGFATFSPLNTALLNLWFYELLGMDLIIELPNYLFGLLGMAVVYALAREMRIRGKYALWGAAFFGTMPVIVETTKYCLADLPMAVSFMCGLFYRLRFERRGGTKDLYLFALSVGLLLGTKVLGAVLAVVLLASLVVGPFFFQWRRYIGHVPVLAMLLIAVGGFWYVKNAVLFHNPIYPQKVTIFGHVLFPGRSQTNATFGIKALTENLRRLTWIRDGQNVTALKASGWGGQFFIFWLPVFVLGLWRYVKDKRLRKPLLLFAGIYGSAFLAFLLLIRPVPWWFKYVSWFPGIIAVGYAGLLGLFKGPLVRVLSLLVFFVSMIIASGMGAFIDKDRFKTFMHLPAKQNATAIYGQYFPKSNPFAFIYNLKGVRTIGYYYSQDDNFIYPLFDNQYKRKVLFYTASPASAPAIERFIQENKVDVFYTPDETMLTLLRSMPSIKEIHEHVFACKMD